MARVVTTAGPGGKGALSIAGVVIDAELPKQVKAGQDLRLVVKEVTAERVVLTHVRPGGRRAAAGGRGAPRRGHDPVTEREESEHGTRAVDAATRTRSRCATTRRRSEPSTCGSTSTPAR